MFEMYLMPRQGTVAGRECGWEKWMMLGKIQVTAGASARRQMIGTQLAMETVASGEAVEENHSMSIHGGNALRSRGRNVWKV